MQNHWVFIDESKIDRALEETERQMREITVYIIHES